MTDQDPVVVVIDSDPEHAEKTASFINFLGYPAAIATGEASLRSRIVELPEIIAILVTADAGFQLLAASLHACADNRLKCACFLVADAESTTRIPSAFKSRIEGVISPDASYKQLLAVLQDARRLYKSRQHAEDDAAAMLHRNLVGSSDDIVAVRQLISQVAATQASVLITGESGTGKEVVARCIHNLSSRRNRPFVPINCGAIPAELLESELFGHEKGAFTGAISARKGRFEVAEGGTLFLDEIGDMPLDMQVKLLRVLQEQTFERVGSDKPIPSNVRIVAATHRNLEQLVHEGTFRMDLFYRLNVFPIEISPLRDRMGDIPQLIDDYVCRLEREQREPLRLSDCAVSSLAQYYWPGNVRELFNLLERLSILYPQKLVTWSDLPDKFRPNRELFADQLEESESWQLRVQTSAGNVDLPSTGIDLRPHLAGIERSLMTQALMQSEWVVARAAKLLNLQRTTLVEKMRKFDIHRPEDMTGS